MRIVIAFVLICFASDVHAQLNIVVSNTVIGQTGLTLSSTSDAEVNGSDAISILNGSSPVSVVGLDSSAVLNGGDGGTISIEVVGQRTGSANGANALTLPFTLSNEQFSSTNTTFIGGDGGSVTGYAGNILNANGGSGLVSESGSLSISGEFIGGNGALISEIDDVSMSANGGDGVDVNFSIVSIDLADGTNFKGGNGGTNEVTLNSDNNSSIDGGNGLNLRWNIGVSNGDKPLVINNNQFIGGDAGSSINYSDASANGGAGLFAHGGQSIIISNGIFRGGSGGTISANTINSASASGGAGAYIFFSGDGSAFGQPSSEVTILGGSFYGGQAGTIDGVVEKDGYGLVLESSISTLSGGVEVYGRGLFVNSGPIANNTLIEGGTYSAITFTSLTNNIYSGLGVKRGAFDLTGGDIGNIYIQGLLGQSGTMTGGTASNIIFSGAGDHDLALGGTVAISGFQNSGLGTAVLSLSNSVSVSGTHQFDGGTTDVNLWNDDHFTDTMVSGGVLNFNNQDFNLIDGAVMRLTSADAVVNFKGTNTAVKSGAQLDLGAGRTTANALTVESGGSVRSTVYGSNGIVSVGSLEADQLTLDVGASWRLYNDGTFTDYESLLNSNAFLLGVSTNAITHGLTSSDVELIGEGMDAYWLYSINDLVVTNEGSLYKLYARYGMQNLGEALNAEGDFLTLMNLMQSEVDTNVDLQNALINYGSADAASSAITDGFLRTTEMGSTLVGAQSVLADQIGVRTREHLRSFRLAGKTGPSGARGPASWWDRSMNRLHDALPSFNLRDSMRFAQDRTSEPTVSDERPSVKKPWISGVQGGAIPSFTSEIVIPSHYQTWGRAYVADLDQESTDGFAGYDASVRGGVLGVDRRFDHAVVGVAGGMSKTIVTGGDGHSGEADSLQSTVYASYFTDRVYLNAHISFASSDVETDGVSMFGYRSEYDANSLSFFVGAGIGYKGFNDGVMITPEVSLLSSKYSRDGYTSSSSMSQTLGFEDMVFDSYDQWSYQSELGVAFSSIKLIENTRLQMAFQPEFRVHWVHEFEPNPDGERYEFVGSTQALHAQLQSREENLIRLGGGVRCWNWNSQTTEFGLNLDHLKGDAYTEWMFSVHLIHRF